MSLAVMVVAVLVMVCGRYGHALWPIWLWPIWSCFVADMVCADMVEPHAR